MAKAPGTRERLLEATIAVIDGHGEVAVKVDAIADEAGITKPSLYHFFGDREGLIIAAQAERLRRSVRFGLPELIDTARACVTKAEYVQLIKDAVVGFGTPAGRQRRRARLEVFGSAISRPALQDVVNHVMIEISRDLAVLFEIGRDRGWVNEGIPFTSIAVWWHGTLVGRYLVENNPAFDLQDWDDIMLSTSLHLLFGEPDDNES